MKALADITEAIGNTPLVELTRFASGLDGRILAKLDYLNPGFSKKDRAALQIILDAERDGRLARGQPVVELTSGNMGTGLAIVCATRGYPFYAVMSRGNSPERARMMRCLGAEVILVDQASGSRPGEVSGEDLERVEQATRKLVRELGAFRADQFLLEGNVRAHELGTGPELIEQSGGTLNAFCDFVGSGGTLGGVTRALKRHSPQIRCYAIEPEGAEALARGRRNQAAHPIQGGGYNRPELHALDGVALDGYLKVSGRDAIEACRRLAEEEGIFAGFSAGANAAGALQLLRGELSGATIAIVMCDSGLKYLSTSLWP